MRIYTDSQQTEVTVSC